MGAFDETLQRTESQEGSLQRTAVKTGVLKTQQRYYYEAIDDVTTSTISAR